MVPNAALLLVSQIQSQVLSQAAPWSAKHCVGANAKPSNTLGVCFISVWLIFAFFNRISNICGEEQERPERSWIFEELVRRFSLQPQNPVEGWPSNLTDFTQRMKKFTNESFQHHAGSFFTFLIFFEADLKNSLAWEIMWLWFAFAYGLMETIRAWMSCTQPEHGSCWGDVLQMGLGQMMPLVLLILPAFAILESFSKF